ncbi:hypothetical protein [Streptomyces sp. CT34]|uniref:hypothetical protein n=1 Tax=Streptomyces sp. CT34 TaxID=1553907 RepID=UPI00068B9D50|nr:hypothetical protein [Streptomyces sp. CT34]
MSSDTLDAPALPTPAPPGAPDGAVPRTVPRRRTGRWAAAVLVLAPAAPAVTSVVRNPGLPWSVVADYFLTGAVLRGPGLTLCPIAVVMVPGLAPGTLLAVPRRSGDPVPCGVARGYVRLFRSAIPELPVVRRPVPRPWAGAVR